MLNRLCTTFVVLCIVTFSNVHAADLTISETPQPGAFPLAAEKSAADIFYDGTDAKVVDIAAHLLAADIEQVTTLKPTVLNSRARNDRVTPASRDAIYIGTLGHSAILDKLVADNKVDVSKLQGQWESYLLVTIPKPSPDLDSALLIIGSDRRGTAYGALTLSQLIGVSPWTWWADVPPARHAALYLSGSESHGPPSIKYRGIFLNDEDWGLQPWAAKTFEPKSDGGVGDIGPKTYAKIFELLLRLKANYIWPAMHPSTKAFNIYPQNKQVADDYAIVMGSSHCEQLLRNGVTEWKDAQGRVGEAGAASYNWVTNKQGIIDYWKTRLQENGKFENTYTLGLRGVHDSDMAGGGTNAQKAQRLNEIYGVQRDLLKQFVNPDLSQVPQLVIPYKEALIYYQNGAIPADDVTLVWVDDNHGYIRQLSTPAEQKRTGGAGVYYHISYWGAPHDYLWLESTPPALIWEELSKAYDYNARTLWVINVGDLKPAEIGIDFALNFAYDTSRYTIDNLAQFLPDFARRTFGPAHASEIAAILDTFYHLNYQRKPEHLGFNTSQNPGGPIQPTEFSDTEIRDRLAAYAALTQATNLLYDALPKDQRDSFYELVVYPVRCSDLQNQKILNADLNRRAAARGDAALAADTAKKSTDAYNQIQTETAYYNDTLAGGKWKNMMSANPHPQAVFALPRFATVAAAPTQPILTKTGGRGLMLSPTGPNSPPFNETVDGYLSIAAEHPTRNIPRNGAQWKTIPGLGRLGDSMAIFPTTTPSIPDPKNLATSSPTLEYDFFTFTPPPAAPAAKITVQAIPTHRINPERGLRYAIAVDDETPQIVDLETPENNRTWSANVLRAAALGTTTHNLTAGSHTLHIYMVDPGVVLDHFTIDLGGLQPSYLPPSETRNPNVQRNPKVQ